MKKLVSIVLIFVLCFTLFSCKRKPDEQEAAALPAKDQAGSLTDMQQNNEQGSESDAQINDKESPKHGDSVQKQNENNKIFEEKTASVATLHFA